MKRTAAYILICLLVSLIGAGDLSATQKISTARKTQAARKTSRPNKSAKSVKPEEKKPENYVEKAALVNVPISEVFSRNSKESEHVTEVLLSDEFRVVREDKEWAYGYIPSQKGYSGWIRKENILFSRDGSPFKDMSFVQVKSAKTRVTFKDGAYINVYAGTRLPLLKKDNRRYEVAVPDGSTGYLPVEAAWVENDRSGKEVTPEDILQASKFHGSDYKWGGITAGGMDCSGFVYTAFRINGIYLKRDSYLQAEEGSDVRADELKAGDLVFFKSEKANRITHVGIYIGDGNFIHSSRSKKGVSVSSLSDEPYTRNFAGARRILNHSNKTVRTGEDSEKFSYPVINNHVT